MKIIGLTGTIASGKSTVSDFFIQRGVAVIDADKISREITDVNGNAVDEILSTFGEEIKTGDGIDRRKLAGIVFSDLQKKKILEQILHPKIIARMFYELHQYEKLGHEIAIFDIPLLFEGNFQDLCNEIWVVYCDLDVQIERLKERNGFDEEFSMQIISNQMPTQEKLKRADVLIENNGSLQDLYAQLSKLLNSIKK